MATILDVAKTMGALMGTYVVTPDTNAVKEAVAKGYRFIAYSIDTLFLGHSCRDGLNVLADGITGMV